MKFFDRHPFLFRAIYLVLAFYALWLIAVNFNRYASSPTDENWFRDTPSPLYFVKSLPATVPDDSRDKSSLAATAPYDSIAIGDLLLTINGNGVKDSTGLNSILAGMGNADPVRFLIFRPKQNTKATLVVDQKAIPEHFFRTIPPTAYVFDVIAGGASDRAGMLVGDLIVRINDQTFHSSQEADRILRTGKIGKAIAYDVIRDNRIVRLQVTLANWGMPFSFIITIIVGIFYVGTGIFLVMRRPQLTVARLLGLCMLALGSMMMLVISPRNLANDLITKLRGIFFVLSFCFAVPLMIHTQYYFPKIRPELLARRINVYVPYALATILTVLMLFFVKTNTQFLMFLLGYLLLSIGYVMVVKFLHRKQRTDEHKKLSRITNWSGWIAGALATAIGLLVPRQTDLRLLGFVTLPLILIPLAYLYTIGRYRLLDLDLRVRRNIQYTIISLVWAIALITIFVMIVLWLPEVQLNLPNVQITGTSVEILDTPMAPVKHEFLEKMFVIITALAISVVFLKIGRMGQKFLAAKFHFTAYDYRRAASELSEVMATKLTLFELARGIVQKLAEIMHLKRVGVMFFENLKTCCCQEAHGFDGTRWEEFCLNVDKQLIAVLEKVRSDSRFSVDYLPENLRDAFLQNNLHHIIPIRFKEKLVGTLLIGEKLSEAPYTQEDLTFLAAVAKQASLAVENAFMHEELAEQQRLKHEFEIARRIQLASLPQKTPQIDGLDIAGISIPAMEVGGDYFDYLNGLPDKVMIIIGDVSGKGTSAALYMSKIQGILRSLHGFGLSPRDLFIRANELLCQDMEKKSFVTSIGANFYASQRRLDLARAGHLPVFYYHAGNKTVEKITPRGLGLGLDNQGVFATEMEERRICYEKGDVFVFITDGITEAQNQDGLEFGEERVEEILTGDATTSAEHIRDSIITAVKQFAAKMHQHDDQTIVVVRAS